MEDSSFCLIVGDASVEFFTFLKKIEKNMKEDR